MTTLTITANDLRALATNDLPHAVPALPGQSVLIRDGSHDGTWVVNLGDDGFLFHSLDGVSDGVRPRCVLVELFKPEYDDKTGEEISNWMDALPDGSVHGCDLEGKGYALIGLQEKQEIDERCGTVLWDSHAA